MEFVLEEGKHLNAENSTLVMGMMLEFAKHMADFAVSCVVFDELFHG